MATKTECKKDEHIMHMCKLTETGLDKKNPKKFKKITEKPEFKCGNCGAETRKKENLCNPEKL